MGTAQDRHMVRLTKILLRNVHQKFLVVILSHDLGFICRAVVVGVEIILMPSFLGGRSTGARSRSRRVTCCNLTRPTYRLVFAFSTELLHAFRSPCSSSLQTRYPQTIPVYLQKETTPTMSQAKAKSGAKRTRKTKVVHDLSISLAV